VTEKSQEKMWIEVKVYQYEEEEEEYRTYIKQQNLTIL
jgi:hypothetical protein